MKEESTGIKHFCAAWKYSMSGLRYAVREAAVRQELALGVASGIALSLLDFDLSLKMLLAAMWVVVLVTELLNTAIEAVVAKVAKEV